MSYFIKFVNDYELQDIMYYFFHFLGFLASVIFMVFYSKKFKVKKKHSFVIILVTWVIGYIWVYVLAWAENLFTDWGANNIVRAFIWFPLIAYIPIKLLKVDTNKAFDILAPSVCLAQAIPHIGCIFIGCCRGYEMDSVFSIYNPLIDANCFPSQLVEALVAWIIFFICIFYSRHEQYKGNGRVYPLFLILFGSTRFLLEFLRDNDKLFADISILAIHAFIMVVVGVIWMIILNKKRLIKKG